MRKRMIRGNSDRLDVWKEYIGVNHSLENGLKTIFLDSLFDREIYDVGPISHLNAGMLAADLALLRGLSSLFNNCSYFEMSRRRSESLGNMAKLAKECYALNRPAGEIRKKGIRNRYMYMMGPYFRAHENMVLLSGDSRHYDFSSLGKKFDIIFINNGQGYDRVLNDTKKTFEYLAHNDSVIVWHDYSNFPEEIRYEVLAGILDGTDLVYREQLFFVSKTKCAIFLSESLLNKIPSK
ncbi:hypothetical protein ACFLTU_05505 [Bacteroidota bacterium]